MEPKNGLMASLDVDCDRVSEYISPGMVKFWNLLVTEGRNAPEKVGSGAVPGQLDSVRDSIGTIIDGQESVNPELEFSREHDWYSVRNR
ncbi:MAG: hypothetical protein ABEJ07_00025 [Candidatus Nanohaloarchaea archaeon]